MKIAVARRLHLPVAIASLALVAGCGGGTEEAPDAAQPAQETPSIHASIPMLAPMSSESIERDTPPPVRERLIREQQALLDAAREAARVERTIAAGCRPAGPGYGLGPPTPSIDARILGHHVEIAFEYARLPQSPACRPAMLEVVVYSGEKASATFKNAGGVGRYAVRGPRGRIVLDVPWFGRPPYRVMVNSSSAAGRRGPTVERLLRCPKTGEPVNGCLAGYRPTAHAFPMPTPILPLRGVNRTSLEATMRYVLAGEHSAPLARGVRCETLRLCDVTFVDPSFPDSPYRVRYRVAGEQVAGCWMAMRGQALDELPYEDASTGRLRIAGCTSWLD